MNRRITNIIRFVMDECIPAFIRDNYYFMYPFFYIAYRGKKISEVMKFKKLVYGFSVEEYNEFYSNLDTISRNRKTDLNQASLDNILLAIKPQTTNLIDIGCGNAYLLNKIKEKNSQIDLYGFDLMNKVPSSDYKYVKGNLEQLPFEDKSFDVVTCSHVIEHIIHVEKAIAELKRVARKQLIVVVPCQRYYFYTLDEHVNFFSFEEKLTALINLKNYTCKNVHGDWVYTGYLD